MSKDDGAAAIAAGIDRLMARYDGEVPGASLLVLRGGQPIVARGYGLADLEAGTPAGADSNYRLASISKQFTAAAILLLAEQRRLGLDDPVRGWLPSLPVHCARITLRDLLTHRSGLVDYEDLAPSDGERQLRDADVLRLLESCERTLFAAGTAYRYSNGGYALLALVVERVSGLDFADFLRERIFLPLGMGATVARVDGGPEVPRCAHGYSQVDGSWHRTDQGPTTAVLGDGGIYSSVLDLARWDAAWRDSRLLGDASRRMATTAWTETDEPGTDYGFGWRISRNRIWHSGESLGFRNVLIRMPRRRLTVVLLSNRNDPEPYSTACEIARLFLG